MDKKLFEVNGIRGDRWMHQSHYATREEAIAKASTLKDMMVVIWDLGYQPMQPVWWARLELGSEFYRTPVLEHEAWIAEASNAREVIPRPPKQTLTEIQSEHAWITGQDWTDIPPVGPHLVETPAQRIYYMDGKRVRVERYEPKTEQWIGRRV